MNFENILIFLILFFVNSFLYFGNYKIALDGLKMNEFTKKEFEISLEELRQEKESAIKILNKLEN